MPGPATLLLLLILAALPAAVAAQEQPTAADAEPAATAADDGATAQPDDESGGPELPDDADLDDQSYEEDEDVFVPTEEIPSDEPIPFPTDI